ncbi:MAG: hypothetical protein M1813_001615 [Trichoglossum hirsutum]|nr:MAG: hypothetical protein M1813_001615 [Trichoglossum hirsutum]
MQYSSIILAALAATGAVAAPRGLRSLDDEIRVVLSNQATETGSQTTFTEGQREEMGPVGSSGPFQTVELRLGKDVQKQDYRCQVLDDQDKPIVLTRGANTDITFGDGGKGEWTFRKESIVSSIICDPTFAKIDPSATEIRVTLSNQATETGSQTTFSEGEREEKEPVGSSGPFETVQLCVGALVEKQDYRCQVLDAAGDPITVKRGQNVDITFGDGDKGEWTFLEASEVSEIICDPDFKKGSA